MQRNGRLFRMWRTSMFIHLVFKRQNENLYTILIIWQKKMFFSLPLHILCFLFLSLFKYISPCHPVRVWFQPFLCVFMSVFDFFCKRIRVVLNFLPFIFIHQFSGRSIRTVISHLIWRKSFFWLNFILHLLLLVCVCIISHD